MRRPSAGKALLWAGIALALLFFLLAPALPLYGALERRLGPRAETVVDLVGLAALILVLAGYPLYKLEGAKGEERAVAVFDVAEFLTFAVFMGIAVTTRELLGLEGLKGMLVGMLAGSPWLVVAYFAYLRRLGERARRARVKLVVLRVKAREGEVE